MNKQTEKNLLDTVKKNYSEISDQFNNTRKKHLWPELIKLTKNVKNNDKILDAGCGNGRLLEAFKDKKIKYLGFDNSVELIEYAQKKYPKQKFLVNDILDLGKIPEINFNYVYCIAVLQHIPGKKLRVAALKQLKNKITEDGKIIITTWNLWSQTKFRKLIFKFWLLRLIKKNKMDFGDILFDWKNPAGQALSRRYYHGFTKRELKKTAKKAGLKTNKIYKDKYNYYVILEK